MIIAKNYFESIKYRERTIVFTELDSTESYEIKGDYFYLHNTYRTNSGPIIAQTDSSVRFNRRKVKTLKLGKDAQLRAVGKKHVLNFREKDSWWTPILLSKTEEGDVIVRIPNEKNPKLPGLLKQRAMDKEHRDGHFYKDRLTAVQVDALISKGLFNDTIVHLTKDGRVLQK